MLDDPKPNKEFIYHYRDDRQPYKGNWRNTAGWTTVWVTGQIIDKNWANFSHKILRA